ncbi:tyrosine-protein phosphatase [Salinicoccus albus]|uniref:tyrosine-protein phosphatase n=1 Tax=Salinicoccus albus TaxID=418756 RepID=UPI0003625160|nr:CpsB/CapC family capsule biosynthesis tyrosine phosphatase [Salinicoccus albus]
MIDIHNHLLIGVDDGPQSEQEAIDLLKQAKNNGITDIITTPHHYGGDYVNPKSKIMANMDKLTDIIEQHQLDINVYPGQEIRINGDLVKELETGVNLSLNQTKYVLIEFSFTEVANYTERLFFDLQMQGYMPVIAHPERIRPITKDPNQLYHLVEKGAIAQITAGSVAGALGEGLQQQSLEMIRHNHIHFVGSDAHHATMRPFMLKEAYEVIERELGTDYVAYLQKNAEAILHDKEVTVKAPKQFNTAEQTKKHKKKRSIWSYFKGK